MTPENAIKTIRMLFMLFQNNHIDKIYSIYYETKINIQEAIQYGFSEKYLTRPSLNRLRSAYGYSGLKTIIFLRNTEGELIDYPNIY